jgi:hypothetical protein
MIRRPQSRSSGCQTIKTHQAVLLSFLGKAHSCTNLRKDGSSPVKCVTKGYEAPPSTPCSWSARMSRIGPTLRHHVWYIPSGSRTVQLRHSPWRVFRRWMMAHWSSAGQSAYNIERPGKPATCSEMVRWLGAPMWAFADRAVAKERAPIFFSKETGCLGSRRQRVISRKGAK